MFGKRKGGEGFEWHRYVRTVVRERREARKEKVREARRAAGQQVGAAGEALAAGSKAAGVAAVHGARAGIGSLWLLLIAAWNIIVILALHAADKTGLVLVAIWRGLGRIWASARLVLARPIVAGGIALIAALALGAGLSRLWGSGLDRDTMVVFCVAAALALATLPAVMAATGVRLPRMPSVSVQPRYLGGALLAGLAGFGVLVAVRHTPPSWGLSKLSAGLTSKLPSIAAAEPITGRAVVMGGDRLRIGNTLVRLSAIELPEAGQLCGKPGGRQFRCGGFGATTLSRLVGGGVVSCTAEGKDSAGVTLARCMRADKDLNAELVRSGHAFAEAGLVLTRYSSEEKEALAAKAGIWAAGESLRPAEWRARVWDEAKRKAPDGCPIKGTIAGNAKVYLLPWSPEYDRGRVQPSRGERWFCSESEATGAGWKPALRG
jgi:endonuclease YncB( thermonuclease family)